MSGEVFNSNTEFPAAGSRLGLNMGESQLVGRAIMSVAFLEGQDWGLSLAASWRRGLALTELAAPTPGLKPDPPY